MPYYLLVNFFEIAKSHLGPEIQVNIAAIFSDSLCIICKKIVVDLL
jgi:hypothetical protein